MENSGERVSGEKEGGDGREGGGEGGREAEKSFRAF